MRPEIIIMSKLKMRIQIWMRITNKHATILYLYAISIVFINKGNDVEEEED